MSIYDCQRLFSLFSMSKVKRCHWDSVCCARLYFSAYSYSRLFRIASCSQCGVIPISHVQIRRCLSHFQIRVGRVIVRSSKSTEPTVEPIFAPYSVLNTNYEQLLYYY